MGPYTQRQAFQYVGPEEQSQMTWWQAPFLPKPSCLPHVMSTLFSSNFPYAESPP